MFSKSQGGVNNSKMKAKIWCEVICDVCGEMVGDWYRNAGTIRHIKNLIQNWEEIDGVNVCEDCIKKIRKTQKKTNA